MNTILHDFIEAFCESFKPPVPYRGQTEKNWLVSRVWTKHMKVWLERHYDVEFEVGLSGGRRLDAAIWREVEGCNERVLPMDIALEWEWDNHKVANDFPFGDFRKLLEVDARCGLAIVQTRVDGKRGTAEADDTVGQLLTVHDKYQGDNRSIALIEVRRVRHETNMVDFVCYVHDLSSRSKREALCWSYPCPMAASRDDRETTTLSAARASIALDRSYTASEFERIQQGNVPKDMDDRWFAFYEEPWLYLHRSWTGYGIYQVRFEQSHEGVRIAEVLVSRDPDQYTTETDDIGDALFLAVLLDGYAGRDTEAAFNQWNVHFQDSDARKK